MAIESLSAACGIGSAAAWGAGDFSGGLASRKSDELTVVLFDPDTIADTPPSNGGPYGRPKGIHHVFINGAQVVRDGSYIPGARAGRVL
jgi:hypothetical protein